MVYAYRPLRRRPLERERLGSARVRELVRFDGGLRGCEFVGECVLFEEDAGEGGVECGDSGGEGCDVI